MSNAIVNESVRRLIIRKVIIALFLDDRFFAVGIASTLYDVDK
jgi:hypothetical protein